MMSVYHTVSMLKTLRGGTAYNLKIHLVFVTKYRRKVINRPVLTRLEKICKETCLKWECELLEFNGEPDPVHLLIEYNPKVQISKFANNLKTVSSRLIRKEFPEILARFYYQKPVLLGRGTANLVRHVQSTRWKIGYMVSSCGGASLETIKKYIQNQDSPH